MRSTASQYDFGCSIISFFSVQQDRSFYAVLFFLLDDGRVNKYGNRIPYGNQYLDDRYHANKNQILFFLIIFQSLILSHIIELESCMKCKK